jgi:hypothetical protein
VWRTEVRACTCGVEFKPKREGQLHCSRRCRVRSAVTRHRSDYNKAHPIAVSPDLPGLPEERLQPSSPPLQGFLRVGKGRVIASSDFVWRGLALHFDKRKRPVLTLIAPTLLRRMGTA